jgi:FkbM family methyltransferase
MVQKFKAARRIFSHLGARSLFWQSLDYVTRPMVRAIEDVVWRRVRGVSEGDLRVNVQGHKMFVLRDDVGISKELAVYKTHEPLTTRVLRQVLKPSMCVVDVGGNIGYFLLIEARMVGPGGLVIGIEPEPTNFQLLRRNVEVNGYANVLLLNSAIGERNGLGTLFISHKSNWHSLSALPGETTAQIPVEIATLDQVLDEQGVVHVDLVRMDIEGYEVRALDGMRQVMDRFRPRLLVEIHPDILDPIVLEEYFRKLSTARYDVEYVLDRRWDHPLHGWRLQPEKMSLSQLARDPRIIIERRNIAALLRPC